MTDKTTHAVLDKIGAGKYIGTDAEFALIDRYGDPVSALHVLGDDVMECEAGRVFADNLNVEIATTPAASFEDFEDKIETLLDLARHKGKYKIYAGAIVDYPEKYLSHRKAKLFGCDPDSTAYCEGWRKLPDAEDMGTTRTLGGHVHLDLRNQTTGSLIHFGGVDSLSSLLDLHLALPMLPYEPKSNRRNYYGQAGCYRQKPYGLEYRTLSSFWVPDSELRRMVWDRAREVQQTTIRLYEARQRLQAILSQTNMRTHRDLWAEIHAETLAISGQLTGGIFSMERWWLIPHAIDTGDVELAKKIQDWEYVHKKQSLISPKVASILEKRGY